MEIVIGMAVYLLIGVIVSVFITDNRASDLDCGICAVLWPVTMIVTIFELIGKIVKEVRWILKRRNK